VVSSGFLQFWHSRCAGVVLFSGRSRNSGGSTCPPSTTFSIEEEETSREHTSSSTTHSEQFIGLMRVEEIKSKKAKKVESVMGFMLLTLSWS
jgi:hypothetical protein